MLDDEPRQVVVAPEELDAMVDEYEGDNIVSSDDGLYPVPLPPSKSFSDVVFESSDELVDEEAVLMARLEKVREDKREAERLAVLEAERLEKLRKEKEALKEKKVAEIISHGTIAEQEDVKDLKLLESVFDKRITEEEAQAQAQQENTRNDSGRLLDKKDVEVKTELNDKEIISISKMLMIDTRYDVPVVKDFVEDLMTLKISRGRKGRTEFIQGLHADERREEPSQSWLSKIFGNKGG